MGESLGSFNANLMSALLINTYFESNFFQGANGFTQFESAPSQQNFNNNPSAHINHVGNLLSGGSRPNR